MITLQIPLFTDGQEYPMQDLKKDQMDLMLYLLQQLQAFTRSPSSFTTIRFTVSCTGDSVKSFLLKTIVTVFRKMFQSNTVVHVGAPTGAAAFNAGGG